MSQAHQVYVPVRGERPRELIERGISDHDFQQWLNALNGQNHYATILKQTWGDRPADAWRHDRELRFAIEQLVTFRDAEMQTETGKYLADASMQNEGSWPSSFSQWPEAERGRNAEAGIRDFQRQEHYAVRHTATHKIVIGPGSCSNRPIYTTLSREECLALAYPSNDASVNHQLSRIGPQRDHCPPSDIRYPSQKRGRASKAEETAIRTCTDRRYDEKFVKSVWRYWTTESGASSTYGKFLEWAERELLPPRRN
ncbi:hypothetical protein JCM3765_007597 [Sporobolomyces pararoseus]